MYYRYNTNYRRVDTGYPRPLSVWGVKDATGQHVPHLDAAFQLHDIMRTFFFYQDQFYLFDDTAFSVDENHPKNIGTGWFGCVSSAYVQGDNGALATVIPSMVLVTLSAILTLVL